MKTATIQKYVTETITKDIAIGTKVNIRFGGESYIATVDALANLDATDVKLVMSTTDKTILANFDLVYSTHFATKAEVIDHKTGKMSSWDTYFELCSVSLRGKDCDVVVEFNSVESTLQYEVKDHKELRHVPLKPGDELTSNRYVYGIEHICSDGSLVLVTKEIRGSGTTTTQVGDVRYVSIKDRDMLSRLNVKVQ